jgi:hypothetical protein
MTLGGDRVASRTVRLPKRSVTRVSLRLSGGALDALRSASPQRATLTLRVRRAGGAATTVRRKLTLRAAGAPAPAPAAPAGGAVPPAGPAPAPAPKPATPAPVVTPPAPADRWVGRMGTEGPYDDLELVLSGGGFEITKAPALPVYCFETGGRPDDSAVSGELFDAPGPWAFGTDGEVAKEGVAVNRIVGRSPRTITYKVTGAVREPARITGTLGMSFFAARTHVYWGSLVIVNCAGSQGFEAVPAS